jgi:hypothetical protein
MAAHRRPSTVAPPTAETATATQANANPSPGATPTTGSNSGSSPSETRQRSGSTPETTPGAGFAELFAAGAKNREGAVGTAARFDPAVAKKALTSVLPAVAGCREPGGPRGKLEAVVAFAPTGKSLERDDQRCAIRWNLDRDVCCSRVQASQHPPFNGLPGTVSQIVSFR